MTHPIPDIALRQHTAILAKTGAGKTTTAKGVVEHVVIEEDARVCILDPIKSDWWGLISSADGTKPGLPFNILGGPHGHVPLDASAGAAVGELVGSGQLPLSIVDMAEFKAGGIQRFFIDFAEALLKSMRGVVYLVIEEAHEFAPKERSGIGAENMAVYWAKKLATAGRSKGIRLIVVSHRVQALHNAVLGSCDTLVAMRLTAPADQGPVIKWLEANVSPANAKMIGGSLSSLPTGTGWIVSGEAQLVERVTFPMITTFDNSKTPTNELGAPVAVTSAPIDLDRLKKLLAVPEPAATNPAKNIPQNITADLAAAEDRGYQRGLAEGRKHGFNDGIAEARRRVLAFAGSFVIDEIAPDTIGASPAPVSVPAPGPSSEPRKAVHRSATASRDASSPLSDGERRLLDAVSTPVRIGWAAASIRSGYALSGGGFLRARKSLLERGIVTESGGLVVAPRSDAETPTAQALVDLWSAKLDGGAGNILRIIAAAPWNAGLTVGEIAAAANYVASGGGFLRAMKALRNSGIVERVGRDAYKLSAAFIEASGESP